MKDKLNQGKRFFGVSVEKTLIPDPSEASRKNMPKDELQEIFALKCPKAGLSCFAFRVPEGHLSVLMGDDIPFADHTPGTGIGRDTVNWRRTTITGCKY